MQAVKTFDSTGIAPNGRLFSGDLNAIQAAAAGLTDFAQTLSLGTLRVGDAGIQLIKHGTAEARITAALRTDGILRGLSGIVPGTFTTAQRNAIGAGFRPFGMAIVNSDLGVWEFNSGSDASPSWKTMSGSITSGLIASRPAASSANAGTWYYATDMHVLYFSTGSVWQRVSDPAGQLSMFALGAVPTGYVAATGQLVSRTGIYADLFAVMGTAFGTGDGSTTFGLPDLRGRIPVMLGTHSDVDAMGDNEGEAVGNRRTRHKHTVQESAHDHGVTDPGHTHGIAIAGAAFGTNTVGGDFNASTTTKSTNSGTTGIDVQPATTGITVGQQASSPTDGPAYFTYVGGLKL